MALRGAPNFNAYTPRPVTLPAVEIADIDVEREAREAQARVIQRRTLRAGFDAWLSIRKTETFDGYLSIGKALLIFRRRALTETGANGPAGQVYNKAMSRLLRDTAFASMPKRIRCEALELAEHATEILRWRDSLSEKRRRRLISPHSVVYGWRRDTGQHHSRRSADLKWSAEYHWRRFISCVKALPQEQSHLLWQAVAAEAAAMAHAF
jgi:hypothetical protein